MKVKICGIRRKEDALAAVEAGADALGFILAAESPRRVDLHAAAHIIAALPPLVTPVGVFVNASKDALMEAVRTAGFRALQLHGEEPPEALKGLPVPAYKAFRVGPDFDCEVLKGYPNGMYLLDTHSERSRGGTGRTFDWAVAVKAKAFGRIMLGGGLTPENVGEAVRAVDPYAIDVNSGVEVSPGVKDHEKIRRLFEALGRSGS